MMLKKVLHVALAEPYMDVARAPFHVLVDSLQAEQE